MKKPKAKDITDDFLGWNTAEAKPAVVTELGKKMGGLPSTEQLALIAATLARNTTDTPDNLTKTAMALWLSARERIFFSHEEGEVWLQDCQMEAAISEKNDYYNDQGEHFLPIPDEYPVTRDQFLRVMLPKYKSRTAELARIAKAFVRDVLLERHQRAPTADEIAAAYGTWNLKPYENAKQANGAARKFEIWYADYLKEIRRLAGLKSAAKKAALKKSRRDVKSPREK